MRLIIEIRAAEGGDDAKHLVKDQAAIYEQFAKRAGAVVRDAHVGHGWLSLEVEGDETLALLRREAGGHRWQRVPPTEKRGRVHTSTVTVAVLDPLTEKAWSIPDEDIDVRTTRDTGPGGQHRNKTESCVVMTHKPTGIQAKAAARCQHHNRREARATLEARVQALYQGRQMQERAQARREQAGTGERGDKVRTYRTQDDSVSDQRTGKRARLRDVLQGRLELLS